MSPNTSTKRPVFFETEEHKKLLAGVANWQQNNKHLKELIKDENRNERLMASWKGIHLDLTREKLESETLSTLQSLCAKVGVMDKIRQMVSGEKINNTEERSVLHTALRLPLEKQNILLPTVPSGGPAGVSNKQLLTDVIEVQNRIKKFAHFIRQGEHLGITGKPLRDVICIGIGGSYLGPEFVYEALKTDPFASEKANGRRIRFLANVDPIDVKRATDGLHPESTLVIVVSKTFTTAETMLNARTIKNWLLKSLRTEGAIAKHFCAVSTNLKLTSDFGINPDNVFGFWDWVGGRFSVTSAVGLLPLAIHFGWPTVEAFLEGCHAVDEHVMTAPCEKNLPLLMGLASFYNKTYLNYSSVAVIPYCQALHRFPAHIQQLSMESNGKVTMNAEGHNGYDESSICTAGEVFFGEPGTNAQHSFFQLIHQGQVVPVEFIGFVKSQNPISQMGEPVSNHDELMSNFFAQPDALAFGGKSPDQMRAEGVKDDLIPHKFFPGNRPSAVLLLPECDAYYIGCLLALYEHRTAIQGFLWGINSFDQWGVELGKVLATNIRNYLGAKRNHENEKANKIESELCGPTRKMLQFYFEDEKKSRM